MELGHVPPGPHAFLWLHVERDESSWGYGECWRLPVEMQDSWLLQKLNRCYELLTVSLKSFLQAFSVLHPTILQVKNSSRLCINSMGSAAGGAGGGRPPSDFGKNMDFLLFVMINLTFCRFRPPSPPPRF